MIERLRKTAAMFAVSAILGSAGLSATAGANPRPTTGCEGMVRAWCAANWEYWYWPPSGYEQCVSAELPYRCRQVEDGWDYPEA